MAVPVPSDNQDAAAVVGLVEVLEPAPGGGVVVVLFRDTRRICVVLRYAFWVRPENGGEHGLADMAELYSPRGRGVHAAAVTEIYGDGVFHAVVQSVIGSNQDNSTVRAFG